MEDNQLTINIKGQNLEFHSVKPIQVDELLTVLFTLQLQAMNDIKNQANQDTQLTKQQKKQIIENIYDQYNAGASNVLYLFAPDIEMRPDLTAQAILEKENEIINKQYDNIPHNVLRFPHNQKNDPGQHIPHLD